MLPVDDEQQPEQRHQREKPGCVGHEVEERGPDRRPRLQALQNGTAAGLGRAGGGGAGRAATAGPPAAGFGRRGLRTPRTPAEDRPNSAGGRPSDLRGWRLLGRQAERLPEDRPAVAVCDDVIFLVFLLIPAEVIEQPAGGQPPRALAVRRRTTGTPQS